jgi:hypothetical protein
VVVLTAVVAAISSPSQALAAAPLSWSAPATIDSGQALSAIACPTRGLCVAVDEAGRIVASTTPAAGASSWKPVASDPSHALRSVSCASATLCAAVDDAGQVLVSSSPAAPASWAARAIDGATPLTGVSCPSESLCVAVDELGRALTSTAPISSGQPWSPAAIDTGQALDSVSCSSAQLCVAVDAAGSALASADPTAGASAWHKRDIDSPRALLGVSCDSAAVCVAVDGSGNALASADPTSSTPTWSSTGIDPDASGGTGARASVSCVASKLCVAVAGGEVAHASDDPADPVPVWSDSRAGVALGGVSCDPEGFCAAVSGGRVLSASVPAPVAITGAPSEVAQTTATLAGTVNPSDALLSDCRFEYGTTVAYGQSAPCPAPALTGSAPQAVTASLAGLSPGTLYHYRLVAFSGAGEGIGADETFTTVIATLVHPHPSISGVPAVGSRLQCNPGVPAGEAVTLSYAWWRDGGPVKGAHGSAYRVARADATHHIQCLVTAVNAAGSATGHSAFVAIPRQGVVAAADETIVGRARARGGRVSVSIGCSPRAARGCAIALRLTTSLRDRHRRLVSASVGSSSARLARGQRRVLSVSLDTRGRHLLAHARRLTVQLSVTGTVIGVLKASLSRQHVMLRAPGRGR